MKAVIITGLIVLICACWALLGLEKRKAALGGEAEKSKLARVEGRKESRVHVTRSERVSLGEVWDGIREGRDFLSSLGMLERLDRDGLRTLMLEVLDFEGGRELLNGRDHVEILARNVIFSAVAETDPRWFLEQAGERKSGLIFVAFQNLLEGSPNEALEYYESLGEGRYTHPPGPGASYRLYQLVFNYLASRDPKAAAEHLFAMDVSIRNLPPLEMWDLKSVGQARALWGALKNQEEDRFHRKSSAMRGAMQRVYELEGIESMKGLWDDLGTGEERREFFNDSGFDAFFQNQQGAKDLQELLASESEVDRESLLKNFASGWGYSDRAGVDQWVRTLARGELRDEILNSLLSNFLEVDESPHQEWIDLMEDSKLREKWGR